MLAGSRYRSCRLQMPSLDRTDPYARAEGAHAGKLCLDAERPYSAVRPRVSGRNSAPMTTVPNATTIGYHRP